MIVIPTADYEQQVLYGILAEEPSSGEFPDSAGKYVKQRLGFAFFRILLFSGISEIGLQLLLHQQRAVRTQDHRETELLLF